MKSVESEPHENERGIIADRYSTLQAIPILQAANQKYPLPKASQESALRSIFQCAEILLVNLSNLTNRILVDIEQENLGRAVVKMSWARGFHHILVQLSAMPPLITNTSGLSGEQGLLRISESPGFNEFASSVSAFDDAMRERILRDTSMEEAIGHLSLDSNRARLIHLIRIVNHEITLWEAGLSEVLVPVRVPGYVEFVVADEMRNAVYDRDLRGDTFFMQFRAVHQVPEILAAEINDCLEMAILAIRADHLLSAYDYLNRVNVLKNGVLASLSPIVESLTTADYHEIRENLGITSGSHSENIHYHLFRDLYQTLGKTYQKYAASQIADAELPLDRKIAAIEADRFENRDAFQIYLIGNALLEISAFTHQWRDGHLNLPRMGIGGDASKSLMGAYGITTVKKMRQTARVNDPMRVLAEARHSQDPEHSGAAPLSEYLDSDESLDTLINDLTGQITKARFKHVQNRTGIFNTSSQFDPPKKREV